MPKKILFLVPYPKGESPSQRFRFEQYFDVLKSQGFEYHLQSFLDTHNWKVFFKKGAAVEKLITLLTGYARRWLILFRSLKYDFIFIHRETTPLGPPVMEWILAKVFRKKIIYDFDDAIWLTDRADESMLLRIVKWRSKVSSICKWSYRISCGNEYLQAYAKKYNDGARYIPTTIDTSGWHDPDHFKKNDTNEVIIGWTGSHSTLKYLEEIEGTLKTIESKYPHVRIMVIADREPALSLRSLRFVPWKKETEVEDLMAFDIGIMPLPDDEWAKGKCGFKALQYMSLKIPAVVSPVGVNTTIVDHGVNGFLASTEAEWLDALTKLIEDKVLIARMGAAGRAKVISSYSVNSVSDSFVALFT